MGLNNVPTMIGAHAIVAWVPPQANTEILSVRALVGLSAQDTHTNAVVVPYSYATALTNGVQNVGGVHVVSFSRPVYLTNNVYGVPNIINAFTQCLWAVGPDAPSDPKGNLTIHTVGARGAFAVNFFTGQTMNDLPSSSQIVSSCNGLRMTWGLLIAFIALLI